MRGDVSGQTNAFCYVSLEDRVPSGHPLRRIKVLADTALAKLSSSFSTMYSTKGRPSIPPETLLKSQMLMALYSIRSDRMFCEALQYNLLYRWFLDMDLDARSFDHSVFSKNRERLIAHDVGRRFLEQVVAQARGAGLMSDEHFTVDGTLIEAWASQKSFRRRDGGGSAPPSAGTKNPTVNFHNEKRSNATHVSTTDPESRLARKSPGTAAKLSYAGHVLMENRSGLCVDAQITCATGTCEREAALEMIQSEHERSEGHMKTVGADKGYSAKAFIYPLQEMGIEPHVAWNEYAQVKGYNREITQDSGYVKSQRIRKRVEEIFGWFKTVAMYRKTRFRGVTRNQCHAQIIAATYNLIRMAKMEGLIPAFA